MAFPKGDKILGEPAKRPHSGVKIDHNLILAQVRKHKGNISRVADAIGCNRATIQRRVAENTELKEAVDSERERFVDELETACEYDAINNAKDSALRIFMLKTRARTRGYEMVEGQNQAHDVAKAAFEFVLNRTANPAEPAS